jgi:RimJ/RimL family protein N-acetyltransferase
VLPTIATTRLTLRGLTLQDAPRLFNIYSDPEVTRFLGDGKPVVTLQEQTARVTNAVEAIRKYPVGLGLWVMVEMESKDVVGVMLLKPLIEDAEVEIGWHLARRAWGNGFASEAGAALLSYGLKTLALPRISAVVRPDNPRSAAVAVRLGMRWAERTSRYYGQALDLFIAGSSLERLTNGTLPA